MAGGNLLEMFYGDPHRWAFTFQVRRGRGVTRVGSSRRLRAAQSYAFLSRMRSQLRPVSDFRDETAGTRALSASHFAGSGGGGGTDAPSAKRARLEVPSSGADADVVGAPSESA